MKIGILTQPLHTNYGGLLQNFALQVVLKKMGHEAITINLPMRRTLYRDSKAIFVRLVRKYISRRKNINNIFHIRPTESEYALMAQHTIRFIKDNIQTTESIPLVEKLGVLKRYNFDAYIVGSDQVWRPSLSPGITAFFLDFLGNDKTVKRIAYAASFGVDSWEYNRRLTKKCKRLASKFDAISVREDSAVGLCRKYLGVNAKHLIDPTLLLNKENYIDLINQNSSTIKNKILNVYMLDKTNEKELIVRMISRHLNLEINSVMPKCSYPEVDNKNIENCIFPPVTYWLQGFKDADFVVTDSFHGVVFSVIFNKPFIAIANPTRGLTRFTSLLKMFNLENRLISSVDELEVNLIESRIDFKEVNKVKKEQQAKSFDFLNKVLLFDNVS